jgi:hypothetical protein
MKIIFSVGRHDHTLFFPFLAHSYTVVANIAKNKLYFEELKRLKALRSKE